nr:uncharacterized protein LOC117859849 isoform X2 [Setaria viridis]
MEKGILALSLIFLLILAAEGSAGVSAGHRLRPHLQIQEELHGKKDLKIQSPSRRLGFGLGLGHEVRTVEMKHHRRMVTGHKGGSMGGAAGAAGAGGVRPGAGSRLLRCSFSLRLLKLFAFFQLCICEFT